MRAREESRQTALLRMTVFLPGEHPGLRPSRPKASSAVDGRTISICRPYVHQTNDRENHTHLCRQIPWCLPMVHLLSAKVLWRSCHGHSRLWFVSFRVPMVVHITLSRPISQGRRREPKQAANLTAVSPSILLLRRSSQPENWGRERLRPSYDRALRSPWAHTDNPAPPSSKTPKTSCSKVRRSWNTTLEMLKTTNGWARITSDGSVAPIRLTAA